MWAHMCNCICKCFILFYSFFVLSPVQKSHLSCPLLCNLHSLPSQRLDIDRERRGKYPLLFACEVGASVCHPLETISADGLEFVHGGQLCWQHQSVADFYSTMTTHYNHILPLPHSLHLPVHDGKTDKRKSSKRAVF